MHLELLGGTLTAAELRDLTTLLADCVNDGASIGFLAPLPEAEAETYWRKVTTEVQAGQRLIFAAREAAGGPIIGSAQLGLESRPNGRHRAEVQKVMVRPTHRRRGIAAALMALVETAARDRWVRLLFLDTSEGRGGAVRFYESLGYTYAGGIPGYALDPDGTPAKNAIYYKTLAPGP
jgi:ribosomal protein S18 acetylase RimI-like enzyme